MPAQSLWGHGKNHRQPLQVQTEWHERLKNKQTSIYFYVTTTITTTSELGFSWQIKPTDWVISQGFIQRPRRRPSHTIQEYNLWCPHKTLSNNMPQFTICIHPALETRGLFRSSLHSSTVCPACVCARVCVSVIQHMSLAGTGQNIPPIDHTS